MAKKNNSMIAKLIMLVVAGLGFLTFVMPFLSTKILSKTEHATGSEILKNFGEAGMESTLASAFTVLQYATLFAIIAFGILCVLAVLSFVFEGLSVKLSKVVAIIAVLLAIVAIICGYVYVGEIGVSSFTLSFGPWYLLIIAAVHAIVTFFAFRKW